jgi:hypothetical protein
VLRQLLFERRQAHIHIAPRLRSALCICTP